MTELLVCVTVNITWITSKYICMSTPLPIAIQSKQQLEICAYIETRVAV